jgi:uncharacterized protein YecE (DUF72 family)
MEINIGTSGWSYNDWMGNFYPESLRSSKGEWLNYYGQYLKTVEINSTFYRVPSEHIINSWVKKAKNFDTFEFSLKLPQAVTHEAIVKDSAEKAAKMAKAFEITCIRPLAINNLLGAVLIQLSPFFRRYDKYSNADNLPKLKHLFELLDTQEHDYSAEFRHSSWLNKERNELDSNVLEILREYNVANCQLDGPGFPKTKEITATHGYIRFHGRNKDIWFQSRKKKTGDPMEDDSRMNRYDYLYTDEELLEWQPNVKEHQDRKGGKSRIYFNNHPNAQAIKNAFMLMDMLGMPRKAATVKVEKQFKLDSF